MTQAQKFQRDKSTRPEDLLIGIVASILLHSILLIGANNWWRAFAPEHKRELSEPILIEYIDVPPKNIKPPPTTLRRAATDSVASRQAKPERPVSAAKLAPPVAPKASSSIRTNSSAPKSAKSVLPEAAQSAAVLPDLSRQKPQPKPQITTAVPATPKPQVKPRKTVAASVTPKPQPLTTEEKNGLLSPKSELQQLQPKATPQTPFQPQPSQISGAASSLGGPISLSSRNFRGDYQAVLPNSNRSNWGTEGIDARRDVDLGSYLEQLQLRVKQQWIPGLTQYSRRTVVYFVVSRSGQVISLQIGQPSGSSVTDEAALSAVERAAPFAPLPTGYTKDYINIKFTFNITVSGELELWGE